MEKIGGLPNLLYAAALIFAALVIALLPLVSPFGTIKLSDTELMQRTSVKIPLSAL